MRLTKKEWRIVERALMKFLHTVAYDEDGAPETNDEIQDLHDKVWAWRRANPRRLLEDERKR